MNRNTKLMLAVAGIVLVVVLIQRFTSGGIGVGPQTRSDIPLKPSQAAAEKTGRYPRAKEFVSPGMFFNAEPFTLASLIGKKVILIDFWTYSCINCQRTQPYLNAWYAKYRALGLEIVGVHTPEFEFEKVPENVHAAVAKAGIKFPVVQDNEFGTWRAYGNQYWPHKYLIDTDGYIVYDHIGEGGYDETEHAIQEALNEHMARTGMAGTASASYAKPQTTIPVDFQKVQTPEIYFGALRNSEYLGNGESGEQGTQSLSYPPVSNQDMHAVYLTGQWDFTDEFVRCISSCGVRLKYSARQVNLVASSAKPVSVGVSLDGATTPSVQISSATLYRLIDLQTYGDHTLELTVSAGTDLFTFTFS